MTLTCPFCNASLEASTTRCPYCNGAIDPVLRPGERVADRFAVQDVLGAGPLGNTYRVRDVTTGVDVALLAIADELCPTNADRLLFLSRIEMFAGRTIAGCVMPLEVGSDDRCAFVTSPIVEGVTLRAVLGARSASRNPLSREEALRVMVCLAASTSALHSATPHGGLCPDTVMVTARGLLLTDCTVALAVPLDKFQPRIQRFQRAVPFVSPEAARGKRISAVADLYALGAIGVELLTGSPLARALETAQLDPSLETPLRALLDRDPGRRPGALGALLDALARASGLERRPAEPPLPVPEIPSPAPDTSRQAAADWAAFTAAPPAPARDARREHETTVPRRRYPGPEPVATVEVLGALTEDEPTSLEVNRKAAAPLPPTARPAVSVAVPSLPGRLGPATGAMQRAPSTPSSPPPDSFRSGPPGGLSGTRSGPPIPSIPSRSSSPPMPRVPSLPSSVPTIAPRVAVAQAPVRATPMQQPRREPERPPGRDLDGIDPRLLRAARRIEADRRSDGDEIDVGEIELLDD